MDLKTATIDGKIMDVVSEDKYRSEYETYTNPSLISSTAVEVSDQNGVGYVLPFRGKTDDKPGIYPDGCIYFIKYPDEQEASQYRSDSVNMVDFSDVNNISQFLDKNRQIRDMETNVLTDADSIFTPPLNQDDSPEMRAFKQAIASKHMDINRYAPRFGDNYLNDKRILKTSSITMNKLIAMSKKLDIEVELTLRNSSSDVANPMDKPITVILTGNNDDKE
nr:MAG TPA: hypothetical protein [Caudoviricetes sp.]